VQIVACECRVCVLRVATGLVSVVTYVWSEGFFFAVVAAESFFCLAEGPCKDRQEKIERVCCLSACQGRLI